MRVLITRKISFMKTVIESLIKIWLVVGTFGKLIGEYLNFFQHLYLLYAPNLNFGLKREQEIKAIALHEADLFNFWHRVP